MSNPELTDLIKSKFPSYKSFAEAIGIKQSILSRYIHGNRRWPGDTMLKAAQVLKIKKSDYSRLFYGGDHNENKIT